jgi:hypothetical protein
MNGRKTAAFWYDVDFIRPTAELALEHGVSKNAIQYHRRRLKRVGHGPDAKYAATSIIIEGILRAMWESPQIKPSRSAKSDIRHAVLYEAKEVKNLNGTIHTSDGELFWVIRDHKDNAISYAQGNTGKIPGAVRVFGSVAEANLFMKVWDGYPWYAQPKAWKVISIRPKMTTIQSGWEFLSNE